jgi:hypothetical protein
MTWILYTCMFGGYDKPPAHSESNVPCLVVSQSGLGLNALDASRYYKFFPHNIPEVASCDISVYADGNYALVCSDMLEVLCNWLAASPYSAAFYRHPERQTPHQEFLACVEKGIVDKVFADSNYARLTSGGWPADAPGLTENNVIVRKHHDPGLVRCENVWWDEWMNRGIKRDQLLLQYAMWATGYTNYAIREDAEKHQMFRRRAHGS